MAQDLVRIYRLSVAAGRGQLDCCCISRYLVVQNMDLAGTAVVHYPFNS